MRPNVVRPRPGNLRLGRIRTRRLLHLRCGRDPALPPKAQPGPDRPCTPGNNLICLFNLFNFFNLFNLFKLFN